MKILVVDDNAFILEVIKRMLSDEAYEVTTKESSFDAMMFLEEDHECDLVITDLVMPYADGGEFSQFVRKRRPNTPILAITGDEKNSVDADDSVSEVCIDEILHKPLEKDELIRVINRLVRN